MPQRQLSPPDTYFNRRRKEHDIRPSTHTTERNAALQRAARARTALGHPLAKSAASPLPSARPVYPHQQKPSGGMP
jgi:hypothetical protein